MMWDALRGQRDLHNSMFGLRLPHGPLLRIADYGRWIRHILGDELPYIVPLDAGVPNEEQKYAPPYRRLLYINSLSIGDRWMEIYAVGSLHSCQDV